MNGTAPDTRRIDVEPRPIARWKRYFYETIAAEISAFTRYYDAVIQWRPEPSDSLTLLSLIESPSKTVAEEESALPDLSREVDRRSAVLLNGTFNYEHDVVTQLRRVKKKLSRTSRLLVVVYNAYLRWLYVAATRIGLRTRTEEESFLTYAAIRNLAALSGYEVVRVRPTVYLPWRLLGLGSIINSFFVTIPFVRNLSIVSVVTLRPIIVDSARPSLSIVIPARNEAGNIESAIKRLPDLGADVEIIFVEGHSSDGTWEEIGRVAAAHSSSHDIKTMKQDGRGKADAVRLGFSVARGDLLTILDADLTMPPELLGQFYEAWVEGVGEFINGNRLVYPMEGEAMRFLNHLGNIFFAKSLSWVLGQPVGDSLCGTKLVARHDYRRFEKWRADFGDFDPFGDFELLFAAADLGLRIVDVPVRYRARTYGSTNIHRFGHGLLLLKMTLIGFARLKLARVEPGPRAKGTRSLR
ncbi:MAG TPA: glycosyltransferase family 2 protein [Thermoanaerobaculia bacterium]|nr:glycosyltransferase family 2 protein [Thermoanaerobaculia bacterium]